MGFGSSSLIILPILVYGLVFLTGALIARAVLSIPTIVKSLKIQTLLLEEMAKRNGVDPDVIDEIKQSV